MKKKTNEMKAKLFRLEKKRPALWAVLLLISVMLAGCGSSKSAYSEMAYDTGGYAEADTAAAATEEAMLYDSVGYAEGGYAEDNAAVAMPQEAAETSQEEAVPDGRKLIKTVDLSAETENYDALLVSLEAQIRQLGGYVEYQYQYNGSSYSNYDETRNAYMSVRIPVNRLDEFVQKVGEQSNITNKEERVEDVTLQYVDLESRKKALLIEQDRLLELLEKAETVEDIITIEQRLSDVRYELENMESQLRTLTNRIDYSTVNISIEEVKRLTPTEERSAWDRMKNGFVKSVYRIGDDIEAGFIGFIINLPYFIIWLVIIAAILAAVRAILRRKARKKAAKEQQAAQKEQKEQQDETK